MLQPQISPCYVTEQQIVPYNFEVEGKLYLVLIFVCFYKNLKGVTLIWIQSHLL